MRRTDAAAWVISVCAISLRLSQAKTLGALVGASLSVKRVSLANIGRAMLGAAKHQIKRCWRFCANERIETADALRPIVAKLLKKRKKRKLLIAVDWVDIKGFQTLMAGVVLKGRSTPIAWASTTNHVYDGHRSRNAFEESLLLVLRDMIPRTIKVVILADRGFGRTALASFCQRQGFGYVIRIQPSVTVRLHGFHGKLLDYPVNKGIEGSQAGELPQRRNRHAERSGPLEKRPAQKARRMLVPDDRPARHGPPALQALRPTNDHRAALPRRQEQTQWLEPA